MKAVWHDDLKPCCQACTLKKSPVSTVGLPREPRRRTDPCTTAAISECTGSQASVSVLPSKDRMAFENWASEGQKPARFPFIFCVLFLEARIKTKRKKETRFLTLPLSWLHSKAATTKNKISKKNTI